MSATYVGWSRTTSSGQDESFVLTTSGSKLRIHSPHQDQIHLKDILRSLPKLCRFTGHCDGFYSVAQHSVYAYRLAKYLGCQHEHAVRCLIHDFSEAYVNDLNSPVKNAIHQSYRDFEGALDNIVSLKLLNKPYELIPVVKTIDNALYHAESVQLMPESGEDHHEAISALGMYKAVVDVVWADFSPWNISKAAAELERACEEAGL